MDSKVLIKLPRKTFVEELNKEILLGTFEKHVITNTNRQFSNKKHTFKPGDLQKPDQRFIIKQDTYLLFTADFLDEYKLIKRLAQIITLKDIGRIITLLGVNKNSIVVEAGSGSGAATTYLANIVKEVHTYEVNDDHLAVAKENVATFGCKNVTFYKKSIYEEVKKHEADGFLLDVPEPINALPQVIKALRMGGRCVMYTPNLTQAQEVVNNLPDTLLYEETIELTERTWNIKGKVLRPRMQGLGHTAFLTLLRKIPGGDA